MEILIVSCAPIWVIFQNSVTFIIKTTCYKRANPDKQENVWLLNTRKILHERMTEDGDSFVVYKGSHLRICMAMYIDISTWAMLHVAKKLRNSRMAQNYLQPLLWVIYVQGWFCNCCLDCATILIEFVLLGASLDLFFVVTIIITVF